MTTVIRQINNDLYVINYKDKDKYQLTLTN